MPGTACGEPVSGTQSQVLRTALQVRAPEAPAQSRAPGGASVSFLKGASAALLASLARAETPAALPSCSVNKQSLSVYTVLSGKQDFDFGAALAPSAGFPASSLTGPNPGVFTFSLKFAKYLGGEVKFKKKGLTQTRHLAGICLGTLKINTLSHSGHVPAWAVPGSARALPFVAALRMGAAPLCPRLPHPCLC